MLTEAALQRNRVVARGGRLEHKNPVPPRDAALICASLTFGVRFG